MDQTIIEFLKNIPTGDYIILVISIIFLVFYIIVGLDKIYKTYLGIILGLFLFTLINLWLGALDSWIFDEWSFKEYLVNNKESVWFYSIFFIPLLTLMIPLNKWMSFSISKHKILNIILIFLFWFGLFSFLLSIYLSIIANNFLFPIDSFTLDRITSSFIDEKIFWLFRDSYVFDFIHTYNHIINLVIISFIFYKLTIWGIVEFLWEKIFWILWALFKKKKENNEE